MALYTQLLEDFDHKLKDTTPEERAKFSQNYFSQREGKNAAFKDWADNLKLNEKRPRGKFFKNYKRKILVLDEAWRFASAMPVRNDGIWLRVPDVTADSDSNPDFQPESHA
jgi:hypothetical protein